MRGYFGCSRTMGVLLATTAFCWAGAALAQDAGPTPEPALTSMPQADIVVTANKRSESLQKVPISIDVLTSEALTARQVQSFDDYAKLLPSVSFQSFGPGQSQIYFRGITTGADGQHAGPLPTSGLYVNETPVTTIGGSLDIHVYDMARVEALSGPQGTLYGASSLAGTLRLITNRPDFTKFSAGYNLEGNKFGKGGFGGQAEAYVNVPLSDRAAIRLVGFYTRDGGYIDNTPGTRTYQRPRQLANGAVVNTPLTVNNNRFVENDFNDVETYGGRAALEFDLDDNWTVTPSIIYQHQRANGTFLFDPKVGDLKVHDFVPDFHNDDWYIASMTVQGKLSDWDVTYAGSYMRRVAETQQDYSYFTVAYDGYTDYNFYRDAAGNDIDPTQVFHSHDIYTKQSHELRVNSPLDERIRLTAGMFLQRQTNEFTNDFIIPGVSRAVNPFSPPVPGARTDDVYQNAIYRVDRDYAVFGEVGIDILPKLTLNAGLRGFMANNTLTGFSGSAFAIYRQTTCTAQTVQACPNVDKRYVQSGETHKVNLAWQVTPTKMLYATYSTGFRPGGNNRDAFARGRQQVIPPYQADTLTNYELGWKTSWFDRKLRVNGALFWEVWNGVQYSLPGLLGIYYTVNAGAARSRGIEGDVNWVIADHLTLSASGTYLDAQLTKDFGTLALKGTRLPVQPRLKVNATARYDFETGALRNFVQGSVNHQSGTRSYLTDAGEAVLGPTKPFTTFDFSIGTAINNMTVSLFAQNAFDERGILSKNTVCAPNTCGAYARLYAVRPQRFGIRFGQKF